MPPSLTNGKICYIEMPAVDIKRSADFYQRVFDWNIRQRGDGSTSFDDTTGQVSGTWCLRNPSTDTGLLIYIMVADIKVTIEAVVANGGEITQPVGVSTPEITARFRDPGGNILGLYQDPSLASNL